MSTVYKKRAKYLIIVWMITWIAAIVYSFLIAPSLISQLNDPNIEHLSAPGGILGTIGSLITYVGYIGYFVLIAGVYYIARAKGYAGWIGIVLGLFSIFGLLIMLLVADKNSTQAKGSKNHNKLIIALIAIPIVLIILGFLSSMLLEAIDPIAKIEEGRLEKCSQDCANSSNVDACVEECMIELRK